MNEIVEDNETDFIYQHYKGGQYRLLMNAIDANTHRKIAVYVSLQDGIIYTRDWQEFHEIIGSEGVRRFTQVPR